ncbi:iron-sulfur cluster assembly scaffold protein [Candidatus Parcubacteria bacterium]|nr:iron-sulfur cluster assembly scaffold protein [Candidatus Parcubacteria bacterium]
MDSTLYRRELLDHAQNPRNYGAVKYPHFEAEDANVFCGDRIRMTGTLTKEGKIAELRFEGEGCAISQAAASILTDYAKGKVFVDIAALTPAAMTELLSITLSPIRLKCALLPLVVVQKAYRDYDIKTQVRR